MEVSMHAWRSLNTVPITHLRVDSVAFPISYLLYICSSVESGAFNNYAFCTHLFFNWHSNYIFYQCSRLEMLKQGIKRVELGITEKVHHKSIVVAVDVGGRVWLELDGDVSHRGVEFESRTGATVLAQYLCCQVITIIEGQQVILPQMETVSR